MPMFYFLKFNKTKQHIYMVTMVVGGKRSGDQDTAK